MSKLKRNTLLLPADLKGTFVAADPGRQTGIAVFCSGYLVQAFQLPIDAACRILRDSYWEDHVRVERPIFRPGERTPPNDLIALGVSAGRLAGSCEEHSFVYPHEWKGSLDKPVCHRRAFAVLSKEELRVIAKCAADQNWGSKTDDVQDAIALGLASLGRIDFLRPNG